MDKQNMSHEELCSALAKREQEVYALEAHVTSLGTMFTRSDVEVLQLRDEVDKLSRQLATADRLIELYRKV